MTYRLKIFEQRMLRRTFISNGYSRLENLQYNYSFMFVVLDVYSDAQIMEHKIWEGKLEGKTHLEELVVNGRIAKCIYKKQKSWTEFNWIRQVLSCGLLWKE